MNGQRVSRALLALCLAAGSAAAGDLSPRSDLGPGETVPASPATVPRLAPATQGSTISALQRGNHNQASVTTNGLGHDIVLAQHGSGHQASVAATGSNSRVAVGQHGSAHSVDVQVIGNNRSIEVQQNGTGRSDKVILH